jgi:hypothetical protein
MAHRTPSDQREHDRVVLAAQEFYRASGKYCWVNPGTNNNVPCGRYYIDIIASDNPSGENSWLVEVETDDSVSEVEAKEQWKSYAAEYPGWVLAVPQHSAPEAKRLLTKHGISNCMVARWQKKSDGGYLFQQMPGVP